MPTLFIFCFVQHRPVYIIALPHNILQLDSVIKKEARNILLLVMFSGQNTCLKDRKVSGRLVRRCAPGTELVDWLLSLSPGIHTRAQAAGMWQALLEEGVIAHGK